MNDRSWVCEIWMQLDHNMFICCVYYLSEARGNCEHVTTRTLQQGTTQAAFQFILIIVDPQKHGL
jgi:hypothetical protein